MVHVSDLSLQYCVGCGSCYKTGACIYKDDIENLSLSVADADGIIVAVDTQVPMDRFNGRKVIV